MDDRQTSAPELRDCSKGLWALPKPVVRREEMLRPRRRGVAFRRFAAGSGRLRAASRRIDAQVSGAPVCPGSPGFHDEHLLPNLIEERAVTLVANPARFLRAFQHRGRSPGEGGDDVLVLSRNGKSSRSLASREENRFT